MAEKNKGKSLFNGRAQSAANSKENEGSQERSEEDQPKKKVNFLEALLKRAATVKTEEEIAENMKYHPDEKEMNLPSKTFGYRGSQAVDQVKAKADDFFGDVDSESASSLEKSVEEND